MSRWPDSYIVVSDVWIGSWHVLADSTEMARLHAYNEKKLLHPDVISEDGEPLEEEVKIEQFLAWPYFEVPEELDGDYAGLFKWIANQIETETRDE